MRRLTVREGEIHKITFGKCKHLGHTSVAYYKDWPSTKELICSKCKTKVRVYCESQVPVTGTVTKAQVSLLLSDLRAGGWERE